MVKRINVTPELRRAVRRYERASRDFVPGRESTAVVELPLLDVGHATIAALRLAHVRPRPAKAQLRIAERRRTRG